MKAPKDQTELRQFLVTVNQLSKFQPQTAELTKPLRDLLSSKNQWLWSNDQDEAFRAIKESLTSTPTLAHYDASRDTKLSSDASSHGLSTVLRQKQEDGLWRPVAYASRALSPSEKCYAQIEKEALSITWASERFSDYLIGIQYHIETDHKPLVPLLSTKHLEDLPARVQRFWLCMMRFSYTISHEPGKSLHTADTLSRDPISRSLNLQEKQLENDFKAYVDYVVQYLPATEDRLEDIRVQQHQDEVTRRLIDYCTEGWPERSQLPGILKPYWAVSTRISNSAGTPHEG